MMTTTENLLKDCTACGLTKSFIFNVRHRGMYRRFCTACVLKNHSGSFCPICFDVFDDSRPLPSHLRLICFNCSSVSHVSCVNPPPSSTRYRCPSCSDSNFSFFDLSDNNYFKKFRTNNGAPQHSKGINENLAKQLLAAAKIAVTSMNKAAASARLEAEKRVKEAAVTRKRAKEALEILAHLVAKEESESRLPTTGSLHKFNHHVNFASPSLALNWLQNQSPANGSAPPRINAVSQNQSPANGSAPPRINAVSQNQSPANGSTPPRINAVSQYQSPANGSAPPQINAVSLPEALRKESNGLHSSVSRQ